MSASTIIKRLIPLVYFLLVSLPHHCVSDLLDKYILEPYGMDVVQWYANLASGLLFILVFALGVRVVRVQRNDWWRYILVWTLTIALMYGADRTLIVNNIERIHYPQYAVLAMLLTLTLRDNLLIFLVTCFAGAVDEFLQFVTGPNQTNYLDFNDIVLNILGAALGLFMVLGLLKAKRQPNSMYEVRFRRIFLGVVSLVVATTSLALLNVRLVPYADVAKGERHVLALVQEKMSFILSFQNTGSFWTVAENDKSFHEMTPGEGIFVVLGLLVAFRFVIHWIAPSRGRVDLKQTTAELS